MAAQIVQILASPDGEHQVLIVRRPDGSYSYQQQRLTDSPAGRAWGPPSPYAGIYDSAETALQEAFARVKWPQVS
jgi:hypothetical protein